MEVAVRNKRFTRDTLNRDAYKIIMSIPGKDIPKDIILSDAAIEHWKLTKNNIGYAQFDNLDPDDIMSILSSTKRNESSLNINRMGQVTFYKIGPVNY